jgi:hypothetical protein
VTFGDDMARTSHLPILAVAVVSFLSSTWGRADQQTSHDSNESGAFCFARNFFQLALFLVLPSCYHPRTNPLTQSLSTSAVIQSGAVFSGEAKSLP